MKQAWLLLLLLLAIMPSSAAQGSQVFLKNVKGKKIAVVVYAQGPGAKRYEKNALSHFENILLDNDVTVLDKDKADELKDVFTTLDDPGAFVTAETFVENAGKYDIQGLAAVYLSLEAVPGLASYFSATAHADIRYISQGNAKVGALTTVPMGTPGMPPSDGLTKNSAAINAVQRAIDNACAQMGLEVADPTRARNVRLTLEGPVTIPVSKRSSRSPENERSLWAAAKLEKQKWRAEEVTCTAEAPGGSLAAVAGYIIDSDFRRRPPRLYGSRVHVVDPKARKSVTVFECSAVEMKTRQERGTKKVFDCLFVANWRYLAAVNGNQLFLWDTELGRSLAEISLPKPLAKGSLEYIKTDSGSHIVVRGKRKPLVYKIVRDK